jgi:hypothetical protein
VVFALQLVKIHPYYRKTISSLTLHCPAGHAVILQTHISDTYEIAKGLVQMAGTEYLHDCCDLLRTQGPLEISKPVFTNAGQLHPRVKQILHVVAPDVSEPPYDSDELLAETTLNRTFYNCLCEADKHRDFQTLAIPMLGVRQDQFDPWTAAHAAAKANIAFDNDTVHKPGTLRSITFSTLTLSVVDILNVVFRQVLQDNTQVQMETHVQQETQQPNSQTTQQEASGTQWYPTKCILKHQKRKNKHWYLVHWEGTDEKSWVERQNVSEAALRQFNATHKSTKRRRRN